MERKIDQNSPAYDGDLPKLYKRVRKLMNMDDGPYREKEMDSVLQLLRGLTTVVDGLAGMSNKMGDRHALTKPPAKHHAELAVNAAKTLCRFLVASYVYQVERGTVGTE